METSSGCRVTSEGATCLGLVQETSSPPISQLPTELLAEIFHLALPSVEFLPHPTYSGLRRIRMLYALQSVARRWQNIIAGTPTFWTYVQSTFPPHFNETTTLRSGNGPLTIVYRYGGPTKLCNFVSSEHFLLSLAHTFHRWSGYSGPAVPGYLDKPAPHLTKIELWNQGLGNEPFDLLGGNATNLRHVDLDDIPIRWRTGIFTQLQVLKLISPRGELNTTHILDTLLASPRLKYLLLDNVPATIETPPSFQVITLSSLKYINIRFCGDAFTGAILRQTRAPSCIEFRLDVYLGEGGEEGHQLLNEDFDAFHGLLCAIHNRNGSSKVTLDTGTFEWKSSPGASEGHPTFSITIRCEPLISPIRWVELVLQCNTGLAIHFRPYANVSQEMWRRIAPMQCVTRLEIKALRSEVDLPSVLKLLGAPLSASQSLPTLPCLQELLLTGIGWNAQNVLSMVHSRFNSVPWGSIQPTPLAIKMPQGGFYEHFNEIYPRPIIDLTTLIQTRETRGVERVEFFDSGKYDGTLAIAWDEEISEPVWL